MNKAYSMYNTVPDNGTLKRDNASIKGEPIEVMVERMLNNNEPISDVAPLIYTDRKDGVMPEYDIRTDRFEIALDAMDKGSKSHIAKREERHKPKDDTGKTTEPVKIEGIVPKSDGTKTP